MTTLTIDSIELEHVRHDLWTTRLYYLLWFGGSAFVNPFLNLFYISLGLKGAEIGTVTSLSAIVTLVTVPMWTSRSENWQKPRRMLQLFMFVNAITYFLLSQQVAFLGIALITIFRAFMLSSISPLSDAMALRVTKAASAGFGSVRVFGSLAWVLLVPVSGQLVEHMGLKFSLVGAGVLTTLSVGVLFFINRNHFSVNREKIKNMARPNLRMIIPRLIEEPILIGLAIMIMVIGLGNSGVGQFQMTYLSQLGAPASLIGVIGMFSAVVELPFMFLADRLMRKYGAYRLLLLAMIFYACLRMMMFLIPSVPTMMLEQAMNGICFSFYTIGIMRLISAQTTNETETRMMLAFFTVMLSIITQIVSAPLAGIAFDHFGPHILYIFASMGYITAGVTLFIAAHFHGKNKRSA